MFGRTGLTYGEAKELMQSARSPERGKPLQNNTRLYERTVTIGKREMTAYAVRLHNTDVVTILPGGLYMLNHGGWQTVTTQDRIGTYSPVKPYSTKGEWWMTVAPVQSDPEPDYPHRMVPRVFSAVDPGPEPVKTGDCHAGERHGVTTWESVSVMSGECPWLTDERPYEAYVPSYKMDELESGPTRAHNVLRWLDHFSGSYFQAKTWRTHWTEFTDVPTWQAPTPGAGTKNEWCPHCQSFAAEHHAWTQAKRTWDNRCLQLDRYGSVEGWRDAWREDGKRVWRGQQVHREWFRRNHVEWTNGIIVNSEGYVPRSHAEQIFKEMRAYERAEKKAQRELEKRQREQARVDAFKTKILTKREQARLEREAREQRELEEFKASVNTENLHIRLADALQHMRPLIG